MNIYLSSSWKNRERVRGLAQELRIAGYDAYDFTADVFSAVLSASQGGKFRPHEAPL